MADKNDSSMSNCIDEASERPQDWEMLSLSMSSSSLVHPKPSTDAGPIGADVDVAPSLTGSFEEEPKGISDDQLHSKYFGLASSALSEKTSNEKGTTILKQEADQKDAYVQDDGMTSVNKVSSDVDWKEPSPVHMGPMDSGEVRTTKAVSTELESSLSKDEKQQQQNSSSKAQSGSGSTVSSSPFVEETDTASKFPCLKNEETECFTHPGTEILAEPEAYDELRAADLDLSEKPLLESSSISNSKKAWWKQQVEGLGLHISQASALWSLALAATVMGLVILGQRWHHERSQNQQLRLQLGSKDEKINQLIFQISRLKDAVYGRRRVSVMRS